MPTNFIFDGPEDARVTIVLALAATFDGTPAADTFVGTPGPDDIRGRGGDDTLSGAGGRDRVRGDGRAPSAARAR